MIRNTKEAEDTLKNYETRLRDVSKLPAEEKEVEDHRNFLKVSVVKIILATCFNTGVGDDICLLLFPRLTNSPCAPKLMPTRWCSTGCRMN